MDNHSHKFTLLLQRRSILFLEHGNKSKKITKFDFNPVVQEIKITNPLSKIMYICENDCFQILKLSRKTSLTSESANSEIQAELYFSP